MIKLSTYQVTPYFANSSDFDIYEQTGGKWLRETVLALLVKNKRKLDISPAVLSLFHNHHPLTGETQVRYPLVIYHNTPDGFYLTGIDEGAEALQLIFGQSERPWPLTDELLLSFKNFSNQTIVVENTPKPLSYRITNWLPLNSSDMLSWKKLSLSKKNWSA